MFCKRNAESKCTISTESEECVFQRTMCGGNVILKKVLTCLLGNLRLDTLEHTGTQSHASRFEKKGRLTQNAHTAS